MLDDAGEVGLDSGDRFVYWIHLESEQDPFVHGYIGVIKDIEKRWRRHKRHATTRNSKRNGFPLYRAFRESGLALFRFDVIAGPLDKHSAHNLEYALRPHRNIGHNLQWGGYWHSCLLCCTLSPTRFSRVGAKMIEERIQEVLNYQRLTNHSSGLPTAATEFKR